MNIKSELLQECKLQLEYLNGKFGETGTTNALLSKINVELTKPDFFQKKATETLERKEKQMEEVSKLYNEYNNGSKKYSINEIDKIEVEIRAEIKVLRFLLSND